MKRILSKIRTALLFSIFVSTGFLLACIDEVEGTFYISDEALKYQIDTTITSFQMQDNFGITEGFYLDQNIWYATHHYFSQVGNGATYIETFGVNYYSVLGNYSFMFVLRAQVEYTQMEIEWNQTDRISYNFNSKKVESGLKANISFFDSLSVRNHTYYRIIEVDFSTIANQIGPDTPLKIFISGNDGLIKFIRKEGIVVERIYNEQPVPIQQPW
ncbi:MAG: hypothetical protein WCX31_17160 [Salinivirgaceae bacterium]|jgi:hypothetical protein